MIQIRPWQWFVTNYSNSCCLDFTMARLLRICTIFSICQVPTTCPLLLDDIMGWNGSNYHEDRLQGARTPTAQCTIIILCILAYIILLYYNYIVLSPDPTLKGGKESGDFGPGVFLVWPVLGVLEQNSDLIGR